MGRTACPPVTRLEPRRLLSGGGLVTTFGIGGVLPDAPGGVLAPGLNGTIVTFQSVDYDAATPLVGYTLTRLLPTGKPDPTFGTNGVVTGPRVGGASGDTSPIDLQVTADGDTFAAVYFGVGSDSSATRFAADGTVDNATTLSDNPAILVNSSYVTSDGASLETYTSIAHPGYYTSALTGTTASGSVFGFAIPTNGKVFAQTADG